MLFPFVSNKRSRPTQNQSSWIINHFGPKSEQAGIQKRPVCHRFGLPPEPIFSQGVSPVSYGKNRLMRHTITTVFHECNRPLQRFFQWILHPG
jgi:hypothetical protein